VADESNTTIQNHFAAVAKEVQASSNALLRPFIGKKLSQLTASERAQYSTAYNEALTLQTDAGHLSTFAKVVTVAQVVSRAGLPSAPSGPHVATNVILGLVVGLLLGLLVTWFLESFDRRLRRPDETSELLGLPVLGAVPAGMLGKSPASGDKQPLSITAFRMLRTNVRFLAKNLEDAPRVVLVTSAIAEEGKTTVAMGLALAGASGGLNTLLIEADVHRPVHADRLGLNASPGLADYLTGGVPPEQILQVHPFVDAAAATPQNGASSNGRSSKLTCITAGDTGHFGGEALSSKRFAEMIAEVRQVYDLVVIDSAPLLAVPETSEMVTFVDAMVFCVRLGKTTTEHARAARAALDRLPTRLVGLVLTDLEADAGGYYGYAYGYGDAEREKSAADRVAS
jgi:receptor protein-tyrosine kinase